MTSEQLLEILQSSPGHLSIEDLLREHEYFAQQLATDRSLNTMAATAAASAAQFTQQISQQNPAMGIAISRLDAAATRSRQAGWEKVFGGGGSTVAF